MTALALLVPVLAGLAAFWVLANQPTRYVATATVSVPGSAANSASRVGLFVADFAELAVSGTVLQDVSKSTGVPRADLDDGLEVARIGQSSLFTVVYTGDRGQAVEPVVRAVIAGTFGNLVEVSDTDADLQAAVAAYDAAVAARSAYQDEIGTLQPDRDYTDLSSRIRSLQISPEIGSVAIIARLSATRDALVPQIRRMQELDQAVQDAAQQRDEAQRAAESLQRQAAESQSSSTIQGLEVVEESRTPRLVQGVGVAAVAGLLIGLAALVLPDLLRRRQPASDLPAEAVPERRPRPTVAAGARDAS
ncbi:hypothetical protein [Modestobacter sp. DSM 44400]|uniref:hypothetical protein n=1 Tax=Modestobacter sp. DSM 44400 TaxID=1550230 RepID=UPI000B830503|nr:hypothetical protein [Modestobacter sp. DSM 44400]